MSIAHDKAALIARLARRGAAPSSSLLRAIELTLKHITLVCLLCGLTEGQAIDRTRKPGKIGRMVVRRVIAYWVAPSERAAVEVALLAVARLTTPEEMTGLYREVQQ